MKRITISKNVRMMCKFSSLDFIETVVHEGYVYDVPESNYLAHRKKYSMLPKLVQFVNTVACCKN
jgi:hypothetical protein